MKHAKLIPGSVPMLKYVMIPLIATLVSLSSVNAATILQDQADAQATISAFDPMGQSFIAEDPSVYFAFYFAVQNIDRPNDPFSFSLIEGEGLGGTVLMTVDVQLPDPPPGEFPSFYYDVDLTGLTLEIGQTYTAAISATTSSPLWAIQYASELLGDPYPDGRMYYNPSVTQLTNCPASSANCDTKFRVTPVPVPAALLLLVSGLISLLGVARIRKA